MSRGIGKMQRDILATIHVYRSPLQSWRGGQVVPSGKCWCVSRGVEFELPADVIDMRGVAEYLRKTQPNRPAFQASFSRAVKSLVRRGEIELDQGSAAMHRFYRKRYAYSINP